MKSSRIWLTTAVICVLATAVARGAEPTVYADGSDIKIADSSGRTVLAFTTTLWGPGWKWTPSGADFEAIDGGAQAVASRKLQGTGVGFTMTATATRINSRTLRLAYEFKTEADTALTMAIVNVTPGAALRGEDRAQVTDAGRRKTVNVPFGRGSIGEAVSAITLKNASGQSYQLAFDPATKVAAEGAARIVLAEKQATAGRSYRVTMDVTLPDEADFYLTAKSIPAPPDADQWFPWKPDNDASGPSVIGMADWLDGPAGKYGRITRRDDQLLCNGKPIKFWGINACYSGGIAPSEELAKKRADWYAKYGINAVRFHKFADGTGWQGLCTKQSSLAYDPAALDRMDYFAAQLKQHGIYLTLSANVGTTPFGPDELAKLSFANELKADSRGWVHLKQGTLWFSKEVQDVQIAQAVNMLKHVNPYTKLSYAADPAVFCVEAVNENSALFYTTMSALQSLPTIKRLAGEQFFAWLKNKYGSKQALLAAWGEHALNSFRAERMTGESWEKGVIYPAGNPWFYDPDQLAGQMAPRKQRLLDTMAFLHDQQDAFFDRFAKAVRAAGYQGELIGSNWQAGRAISHFYNLHSDYQVGMIDRHNYFGGPSSMLASPASGTLSVGMQQVADRPFMLSEWIHVFPNEFGVEGPAIIGSYGMGLNGWDVSFIFQNGDKAEFKPKLGDRWLVFAPQVAGVFPAVARQVLRGDVDESSVTFTRNVNMSSLAKGQLGFDDSVTQQYDVKQFTSKTVPAELLAVGRNVIRFTDRFTPTEPVDVSAYTKQGALVASTGQLRWIAGQSNRDGYISIDTPATQAVVGFAKDRSIELHDVTIESGTPFAAIYVTALSRDDNIASDKRLLITTIARAHNTGMRYVAGDMVAKGDAPILMEPVKAKITFKQSARRTPVIYVCDHDGRRTNRQVPMQNGELMLDGARTHTIYYEVVFP